MKQATNFDLSVLVSINSHSELTNALIVSVSPLELKAYKLKKANVLANHEESFQFERA